MKPTMELMLGEPRPFDKDSLLVELTVNYWADVFKRISAGLERTKTAMKTAAEICRRLTAAFVEIERAEARRRVLEWEGVWMWD